MTEKKEPQELTELEALDELEPLDAPEALEPLHEPVALEPLDEVEDEPPVVAELEPVAESEPPAASEPLAVAEVESVEEPEAPVAAEPAAAKKVAREPRSRRERGAAKSEPAASAEPEAASVVPGQKRELEQTPQLLRKASKILMVGAVLPFVMALKAPNVADFSSVPWGTLYLAKAAALFAAWVFHEGYKATHGGKLDGPIAKLAAAHKVVVPVLAGLIAIGALFLASTGEALNADRENIFFFPAAAEILTLLLAAATFSHIFGYEHGGKFNPIFPLMFLGPGLAGLLSILGATAMFGDNPGLAAVGLIGNLVVAAGGCMAIYTMYIAMKQAKVEGDQKRAAQREHRKQQRASRRDS